MATFVKVNMYKGELHILKLCCAAFLFLLTVYNNKGYIDIVSRLTEQSMMAAIEEVQSMEHYQAKGEVCYTYTYNVCCRCMYYVRAYVLCILCNLGYSVGNY